MKKFIVSVVIFSAIIIGLFVTAIMVIPVNRSGLFYMLNVKDSLMDVTPNPRMIFIGGSNVAYSINSKMIRDSLNVNAINCGISVALGGKYMIDEALPHLRKGDIVVIAAEYVHFYETMYGLPVNVAPAMLATQFRNLHMLNATQLVYCFSGMHTAIRMRLLSMSRQSDGDDEDHEIYDARSFNEYGDVAFRMTPHTDRVKETIDGELSEEYCQCFLDRIRRIEQKGCRVLLSPPVICKQSYQPEVAHEVAQWLSANGHPYIVSPDRHCMPDSFGLDTDHHLTEEGSRVFTAQLINELKAAGCK